MRSRKPLTTEQEKLLHKLYFTDKLFFGRDKLFWYLRDNFPDEKISRRQLWAWLKKNELNQLFKQPRKTKNIQSTVLSKPYQQIGIDLMDMQTYAHKGYQYVFTAIDLFSKKAWAVAMKTKSKNEARNAMATILKQIDHKVGSVRSDNGGEFKNPQMEKLMKDKGIKQTFSISGKPQSNGQIERFNGVLKRLIKMTITQDDDQNWPSYLKTLVDNYNSTRSRVTKKTPNELADNTDVETNQKVKANIKKAVTEKNESVMPVVLPVGQWVD